MYKKEFMAAAKRTKSLGIFPPAISFTHEAIITEEVINQIPSYILSACGPLSAEDLEGQCLSIHSKLKQVIEQAVGTVAYFTIGWVGVNDAKFFYQPDETYRQMISEGIKGDTVNLHAWLTLPSMEIIDLSIQTTVAKVYDRPEVVGGVIATHPSKLKGGVRYHPMIIGEEFLFRSGIIRSIELDDIKK